MSLRNRLIRLAHSLPEDSQDRKAVLNLVGAIGGNPIREWKSGDAATKLRVLSDQVIRASDILRMVKTMADLTPGADSRAAQSILRDLDRYALSF